MVKPSKRFNSSLRTDIVQTMKVWLDSLPAAEMKAKCLYAWGEAYSPLELLEAIENQSEFGEEFLNALCTIHRRMRKKDPKAAVTDLIRMSINPAPADQIGISASKSAGRAS